MYPSLLTRLRSVVSGDDYQLKTEVKDYSHLDEKSLVDKSTSLPIPDLNRYEMMETISNPEDYTLNLNKDHNSYDNSNDQFHKLRVSSIQAKLKTDYNSDLIIPSKHYSTGPNISNNQEVSKIKNPSEVPAELIILKPSELDEISEAIYTLQGHKAIMLNLTTLELDKAQRAVDLMAGGTFAIEGWQEQVSEKIFLFSPKSINCTLISQPGKQANNSSNYKNKFASSIYMTASKWLPYKLSHTLVTYNNTETKFKTKVTLESK